MKSGVCSTRKITIEFVVWIYVGTLFLILCYVVIQSQQILFGDGAFFAFTATLRNPWSAHWADYPARIAVFLTTIIPSWVLYRIGLPFHMIPDVYTFFFLIHPILGIACAHEVLPKSNNNLILLPVFFWAAIGMCSFGFPTEAYLTASWFWPVLFGVLFKSKSSRDGIIRAVALSLFCFSHEIAILAMPVVVIAFLWTNNGLSNPLRSNRRETGIIIVGIIGILGALYCAVLFRPANPEVVRALGVNRYQAFDPLIFHRYPMLKAGALVLILMMIAQCVRSEKNALLLLSPMTAAVTFAVEKVIVHRELAPQRLYLARTGILYLLPIFGLFVVYVVRKNIHLHRTLLIYVIAMIMTAQTIHHLALNRDWREYRDKFKTEIMIPRQRKLIPYESTTLTAFVKRIPRMQGFIWSWVMPYQSMFLRLPGNPRRSQILYSETSSYIHITCETAIQFGNTCPVCITTEVASALKDHFCSISHPKTPTAYSKK